MRSFGVVVGEEQPDRKIALWFGMENGCVQAFALDRADEALDSAVGPRVIGPHPGVTDPERGTALIESALVPGAVVGEHTTHADAVAIEEGQGVGHERRRVEIARTGSHLGVHEPTRQIDRNVYMPLASAAVMMVTTDAVVAAP